MVKRGIESFQELVDIVAKLRSPEGCPWDREQTHASLKGALLEECYEALEALDREAPQALCEELGDLLTQVLFHAQIGAEAGEFDIDDVVRGTATKLVRRHPHVFGDLQLTTAQEVLDHWEEWKREERGRDTSVLEGVPKEMPALAYSQAIQERAARIGFIGPKRQELIAVIQEKAKALISDDNTTEAPQLLADLLFASVGLGRQLGVDAEEELRRSNRDFYHRFVKLEAICRERGWDLKQLSKAQQGGLWEDTKGEGDIQK